MNLLDYTLVALLDNVKLFAKVVNWDLRRNTTEIELERSYELSVFVIDVLQTLSYLIHAIVKEKLFYD